MPERWSWKDTLEDGTVGLALSIVPGLAHLVAGRFRQVWGWWLLWLGCLTAGVFVFGSVWALPLLGLAIALHARIALSYGLWRMLTGIGEKVVILVFLILVLSVVYRIPSWATGISWVPSAVTIPAYQVSEGDYLVMRRFSPGQAPLARGTLVLFRAAVYRGGPNDWIHLRTTGQIIGLPGELVTLRGSVFEVGGQVLPPERFPVPGWLQQRQAVIGVPAEAYFVSTRYQIQGHGVAVVDQGVIREMAVVAASDIRGTAVMRWWPLSRRGWLKVE